MKQRASQYVKHVTHFLKMGQTGINVENKRRYLSHFLSHAGQVRRVKAGELGPKPWKSMEYPITPAVRFLRERKVEFVPHLYDYVEKGGAKESAKQLGVDIHGVVKTLVFETNEKKPLIVLMHGDQEVSAKNLARHIGVKSVEPASPDRASKLTGYLVGGTSPFGLKTSMPVYAEGTIFDLEKIYINGGKRGFLIEIDPNVIPEVLPADEVNIAVAK